MGIHFVASKWSAIVAFGSLLSACGSGEVGVVGNPGSPNGGAGTGIPGVAGGPSSGSGGSAGAPDPGTGGSAIGGSAGQGGGAGTGQGGASTGLGGASTGAGGTSGGATGAGGAGGAFVPGPWCSVQPILQNKCVNCHSSPPLAGIPMSLVSYADVVAPAKSNPAVRVGDLLLARMSSTTAPMPPRPATPATASDIQAVQAWINAGMKEDPCTPPPGGGSGAGGSTGTGGTPTTGGTGGGTTGNPFDTPTVCTSNRTMTGEEGATMRPGEACIACHTRSGGEAPRFAIAGTVYPTAHEPNDCVSLSGTAGAQIVIIDANGRQIPLTVNSVGSFTYSGTVALPFQAKVMRNGLERVMSTPQTVGDCNSCHTPAGANGAPGRIMAP